ncbi:MAG: hypothetical protein WBZ36_18495 [Candidatus Nitrosopolaris sp.]
MSLYQNSCELDKNIDYLVKIPKWHGVQQLLREAGRILTSYKELGMFLGYPSCCCNFFEKKMNEKFIDT